MIEDDAAVDDAPSRPPHRGMRCPACGNAQSGVNNTRWVADGTIIRRRRICPACGHRFTTYEIAHSETADALRNIVRLSRQVTTLCQDLEHAGDVLAAMMRGIGLRSDMVDTEEDQQQP